MNASRLKFLSLALGGLGLIVAHAMQERQIEEAVDKKLAERDAAKELPEAFQ